MLLFAAQVPETFAYTLSVALQSGLPIVASALGAFPERLAGVARGRDGAVERATGRWNEALLAAAGIVQPGLTGVAGALARAAR